MDSRSIAMSLYEIEARSEDESDSSLDGFVVDGDVEEFVPDGCDVESELELPVDCRNLPSKRRRKPVTAFLPANYHDLMLKDVEIEHVAESLEEYTALRRRHRLNLSRCIKKKTPTARKNQSATVDSLKKIALQRRKRIAKRTSVQL